MNKKTISGALAMLAVTSVFTACSSDDEYIDPRPTEVSVKTADSEGHYDLAWGPSSAISITRGDTVLTYNADPETEGAYTGDPLDDGIYTVFSPASIVNGAWPAVQQYAADAVIDAPMLAEGVEVKNNKLQTIHFKNLGGVLRLNIKGTCAIKSVKLTTDQPISGSYEIMNQGTAFPYASITATDEEAKSITLDCNGNYVKLNMEKGVDFCFALPQNKDGYSNVSVTVVDDLGQTRTKKICVSNRYPVYRNKITDANMILDLPTLTADSPEGTIGEIDGREAIVFNLERQKYAIATCNVGAETPDDFGILMNYQDALENEAKEAWGKGWKLLTADNIVSLHSRANSWTTLGSVNGMRWISGDNELFLPAAGHENYDNPDPNAYGAYWSKDIYSYDYENLVYYNSMIFGPVNFRIVGSLPQCHFSIRLAHKL